MNKIAIIIVTCLLFLVGANVKAESGKGAMGLTIIKDEVNRIQYEWGDFVINPMENIDISHHNDEPSITSYLNEMNVGKRIVNQLLGYDLHGMHLENLTQLMPAERRANPTEADYEATILNNYVLVIKMDNESIKRAQQNDSSSFKPQGSCYLYQIDLTSDVASGIKNYLYTSSDNETVRGENRFGYEGISVLVKLVGSSMDIRPKAVSSLLKSARCVTYHDLKNGLFSREKGKTSTALKIAFSPLLILKK